MPRYTQIRTGANSHCWPSLLPSVSQGAKVSVAPSSADPWSMSRHKISTGGGVAAAGVTRNRLFGRGGSVRIVLQPCGQGDAEVETMRGNITMARICIFQQS